jgi:hypothetical protein
LGRRCSRGRYGVVVHVGDVDVPSGGASSAPVPWTRTTSALPQHGGSCPGGPDSDPQTTSGLPSAARWRHALLLPPFSPLGCGIEEWGKTLSGWWGASRGSASGCRHPVTGGAGAKMPQRAGIGCAGDEGDVVALQWPVELLMPWFRGQRRPSPWGLSPGESACAATRHPAWPGGAAVPLGTRAGAAGRAHAVAEEEKGVGRGIRRLTGRLP